jgi:hypothetical protein
MAMWHFILYKRFKLLLTIRNGTAQLSRIQVIAQSSQLLLGARINLGMVQDALNRGAGSVVKSAHATADTDFTFEFHHGLKEVGEQTQRMLER